MQGLSRDECIKKLKEIGQHGRGTLEEMKMKAIQKAIKHKAQRKKAIQV